MHLLPCGIKQNDAVAVSDFFKPKDTVVEVDWVRVEEAFFHGRKLQSATIPLPDGYRGYILEKRSGGKDMQDLEGEASNSQSRAEFQDKTY